MAAGGGDFFTGLRVGLKSFGLAGGSTANRGADLSFCLPPCLLCLYGRRRDVVFFDAGTKINPPVGHSVICRFHAAGLAGIVFRG